jgi:predicted DCC family thiol-disulfide oxidoreductase YuxK
MNRLYVLYDAGCPVCTRFREWLVDQPLLVPVTTVAAGSPAAYRLLPGLDHDATLREVTVVSDTGEVWTGPHAWVVTLWATASHRALAERLATPAGLPVARAMAYAAAGLREALASADTAPRGGDYIGQCDQGCAHPA